MVSILCKIWENRFGITFSVDRNWSHKLLREILDLPIILRTHHYSFYLYIVFKLAHQMDGKYIVAAN